MEERRRSTRTELQAELLVKRLDQSTGEKVHVRITNVSGKGIGFQCKEKLDMGGVYESLLRIWTKETIQAFIEIVRIEKQIEGYSYGGIFIGMPDIDAQRIEIYQTVQEYRQ